MAKKSEQIDVLHPVDSRRAAQTEKKKKNVMPGFYRNLCTAHVENDTTRADASTACAMKIMCISI